MGGELKVESRIAEGSKFTISLPTHIDVENQPKISESCGDFENQESELVKYSENEFTGNILVVEDTPTNQVLVKLLLEKLGFKVIVACDGKEAIERVEENSFDLIFMDMHMPIMNGYDATKQLRAMKIDIPIIALTASALKGDEAKCISAGCDDYLSKPINRKRLLEILNKYLKTPDHKLQKSST
jgi:CheY-like chemotaxis protein